MHAKEKSTIILFNPMPVKHATTVPDKKTTSLQVPLVNVPLSLLAIGRMVRDDFDVKIINAAVDNDYKEKIPDACKNALCFAVSSMTCYQIRDGINICAAVKGYKFGNRCIDYYTSQGCASGCDFCSEPLFCGRRWSGLRPEIVLSELEHLAETYNIDTFMIRDSDFFLNIRRVKELCKLLIEREPGIRLTSVNGRMEHLARMDNDTWALARRAGIHEIFIGFESGLKPLNTLEDWGDFDQFDFKAPWFPQEYFDLVREFRDGMPCNSGCGFDEWCEFYEGMVERLDNEKRKYYKRS